MAPSASEKPPTTKAEESSEKPTAMAPSASEKPPTAETVPGTSATQMRRRMSSKISEGQMHKKLHKETEEQVHKKLHKEAEEQVHKKLHKEAEEQKAKKAEEQATKQAEEQKAKKAKKAEEQATKQAEEVADEPSAKKAKKERTPDSCTASGSGCAQPRAMAPSTSAPPTAVRAAAKAEAKAAKTTNSKAAKMERELNDATAQLDKALSNKATRTLELAPIQEAMIAAELDAAQDVCNHAKWCKQRTTATQYAEAMKRLKVWTDREVHLVARIAELRSQR
jgi:hypothetical protein